MSYTVKRGERVARKVLGKVLEIAEERGVEPESWGTNYWTHYTRTGIAALRGELSDDDMRGLVALVTKDCDIWDVYEHGIDAAVGNIIWDIWDSGE